MSSTSSPCAACKLQRRKCTQECIFAPYFPPEEPQKFACIHKVFGASNVSKLLNELNVAHRKDAVDSLAYEAEARLRDPVYGCVGCITILKQKLQQVQNDLDIAKRELATYIGPAAMLPMLQHPGYMQQHPGNLVVSYNVPPMHQQQQQMFAAAQQYASSAVLREQEMQRNFEQQQQQQQQEMLRFSSGFDPTIEQTLN
ncbi:Lateral organ boundaries, LOB [Dillenia turbinata]|uniref:Lateral organ boundaries, LOB n=1 Tax=Dillenia turbinata TaxID=194707 RepID=A0AAN8UVZ7_9MAGN